MLFAIRFAARHGFRVSELCELTWDQVDFRGAVLPIKRKKHGVPSTHPLLGSEIRALRTLRRQNSDGRFVFTTERGMPFSSDGFAKIVARAGKAAGFAFPVHFLMLRHACGYYLLRQPGQGHALAPALARPPQHRAHGAVHRTERPAFRGLVGIALRHTDTILK